MAASWCVRALLAWSVVASPLAAEERAELTFALSSKNLLGDAPPGPAPWDTLEGFRTGRDTRARLALGVDEPGSWPGVRTSALLRVEVPLQSAGAETALVVRDASSSLGASVTVGRGFTVGLRAYPLDTDFVRLGYAHCLDWGGTDVARRESVFLRQQGGAPGVELGLASASVRLFGWLKSAELSGDATGAERLWGGAAGVSFLPSPRWRLDFGLGVFERPPTFIEGATARLVFRRDVDEPELAAEPFRPAPFRGAAERWSADSKPGFAVAWEAVTLLTRQRRYDSPSVAVTTLAPATAVYGSLREGRWASHALVSWRSVPFLLRNEPRVATDETLPWASTLPELGAWLGASFEVLPARLIPSVELGARLPGAVLALSPDAGPRQTLLVGGPSGFTALPPGVSRRVVLAMRAALRLQLSRSVAVSLLTEYQRDPNRVRLAESPSGVTKVVGAADSLLLSFAAQARF